MFIYDALGRLTAAKYSDDGKSRYNYDTSYEYDCMGNITRLNRRGLLGATRFGDIDKLRYTYHGNQVIKIDDDADDGPYYKGAFHFVDGADEPIEYEYDANGNLTKDLNKGISSILYNCLNLPQKILFNDNRKIIFSYDAEGNKRSASYYETAMCGDSLGGFTPTPWKAAFPLLVRTTDYYGNIVYRNDTLRYVLFDGGYVTFESVGEYHIIVPKYHFYIKDHLGNNRIVVDGDGKVEERNSYYQFGGLMADRPSLNTKQPYKYIGKELDRMFGWDMYDHGARWYDTATGRWWSMDALAEKYSLNSAA